jgi:curved DNA-binding protein CbpA
MQSVSAFKQMSVQCHPDKDKDNKEADENFIAIAGAYETLSDENERAAYDASVPKPGGGKASPFPNTFERYPDYQQQFPNTGGQHRYQQQQQQQQQRWKPKNFADINVDNIFRSFFGGGSTSHGGAGSGGAGARHFSSEGGGSEGSSDQEFERLFRGFSFGPGAGTLMCQGGRCRCRGIIRQMCNGQAPAGSNAVHRRPPAGAPLILGASLVAGEPRQPHRLQPKVCS